MIDRVQLKLLDHLDWVRAVDENRLALSATHGKGA
jgi:hypothetical protein